MSASKNFDAKRRQKSGDISIESKISNKFTSDKMVACTDIEPPSPLRGANDKSTSHQHNRHLSSRRRLLSGTSSFTFVVHSLAVCYVYLAPLAVHSQKHPLLNLQHQQQSYGAGSGSAGGQTKPPLMYQNANSNSSSGSGVNSGRPLDRPSLNLVGGSKLSPAASEGAMQNYSSGESIPAGAADWFMMGGGGGGGGDLASGEGRHHASFASDERPPRKNNITSTRRMAEVKQRKYGSGSGKNKTIFDDEQQSSESADSNEIYDDVEDNASSMAGTQKEPECASHGRYYCTFKEDYPLKLVTEVTKYYKWPLEKLFRDLHAQIMPKLAQDSTGNLVCDSITRVVRPGWARNTNERWLVVINTDNYHQYVTEVVCQYGTNSRCNFIPPCYYSSCQQRYNTQKLLVIDPTNPYRGPFLSEFLFPSCCVCYVPSSSDSFQDKHRASPATIYQRTMQQEASSNLNPPQFRPPGLSLIEEAFGSSSNILASGGIGVNQIDSMSSGSRTAASSTIQQQQTLMNSGNGGQQQQQQQQQQQTNGANSVNGNNGNNNNNNNNNSGNKSPGHQPPGPGEIRRAGDQYRTRQLDQHFEESGRQARQLDVDSQYNQLSSDIASFPRLGLADSLLNQKMVSEK